MRCPATAAWPMKTFCNQPPQAFPNIVCVIFVIQLGKWGWNSVSDEQESLCLLENSLEIYEPAPIGRLHWSCHLHSLLKWKTQITIEQTLQRSVSRKKTRLTMLCQVAKCELYMASDWRNFIVCILYNPWQRSLVNQQRPPPLGPCRGECSIIYAAT